MSFTVAPLHHVTVPLGTQVPFKPDLVFQECPAWLKEDELVKREVEFHPSASISSFAFVAEYDAATIGEQDPEWTGTGSRPIQAARSESIMLANLALWVAQPSPTCFETTFHALSSGSSKPIVLQIDHGNTIFCHPNDVGNRITVPQLNDAAQLYEKMRRVPRKNAVWTALRMFFVGLSMATEDLRYPFFWVGLEALFGAEDNVGEISYRLSQRIAFCISSTPEEARATFKIAKDCYGMRSKILHGRFNSDRDMGSATAQSEELVRKVISVIFRDSQMTAVFQSKKRDAFLQDWVFSRITDTPPYPD